MSHNVNGPAAGRWLPAYSSQGELHEKLRAALANSKEGGFHEHQEALVIAGRML
jgi:hypothetical protein